MQPVQVLTQAIVDAKMLVNDCIADSRDIPGPNDTDWDGEAFGFAFSPNMFTSVELYYAAKDYYLAMFWLEVERLANL